MYDLAGRANRYHSGAEITPIPTSRNRDLGAMGLRSLKRSLDEGQDDCTRTKEFPGVANRRTRLLNAVRALAEPVIALLENLAAQASDEEDRN